MRPHFSLLLLFFVGCAAPGPLQRGPNAAASDAGSPMDFEASAWDDGLALISTFRGRVKRYGTWRNAVARDYLVREYLHPSELTKRDTVDSSLLPVLKANRLVDFETGAYSYRLMTSLAFARSGGRLVRARGACLNACGMVSHGWDEVSGALRSDSYWEGEGSRDIALPPAADRRFADELPFVAPRFEDGASVRVVSTLAAPRSLLQPAGQGASLGIGDLCEECMGIRGRSVWDDAAPVLYAQRLTVKRDARPNGGVSVTFFVSSDTVAARFDYDAAGFLQGWEIPGEQEFERTGIVRGPYWEWIAESDQKRVR